MREKREVVQRHWQPAKLFAIAASSVLSLAVGYNALFAQPSLPRTIAAATAGESADVVEVPVAGTTIQLKYDPVVEGIQRQLLASGYYKGGIDGVLGRKTRAAIMAYQQAVGMDATGEPSAELVEHIRFTREVAEASLFTGSVDPSPDAETRASIRRVQAGLADLAYSPGQINGEMTDETRQAIRAFQRDRNLTETGEITPALLAELAKVSGQSGTIEE